MSENDKAVAAANLYNEYVNVINVLNINVVPNINTAISKLDTAYDVFNRNLDYSGKKTMLDTFNDITTFLTLKKNVLTNTTIPAIEQKMQYLKNEFDLN